MSWEIIFETEQLLAYWHGLLTTLSLLLSSLGIGAVLAVACALALTNGPWVLQKLVGSFTYFVRGTPLLIQVYLIYYGLAQLDWIQERWDAVWPWTHFKEPFFCALLAFALNTGGYTAEMLADKLYKNDIFATTFHGDMSQGARKDVLDQFKAKQWQLLITTELAARGKRPQISLEIDGVAAILDLVADGAGCAVLPRRLMRRWP